MGSLTSLLMPVRNARRFLEQRLASLQAQTHTEWELIAVDGGSTDGSLEYLNGIAREESRLQVLFQPGENCYAAWNLAMEQARGDFIVFLSADDFCADHALSHRLQLLKEHVEWEAVLSALDFLLPNGKVDSFRWRRSYQGKYYRDRLDQLHVRLPPEDAVLHLHLHSAYTNLEQLLLRRRTVEKVGPFRTDLGPVADFDFGLRLASQATVGYTPEKLVTWRIHADQLTQSLVPNSYDCLRTLYRIVEERLPELPQLQSQWARIARRNRWRLWRRGIWERRLLFQSL